MYAEFQIDCLKTQGGVDYTNFLGVVVVSVAVVVLLSCRDGKLT